MATKTGLWLDLYLRKGESEHPVTIAVDTPNIPRGGVVIRFTWPDEDSAVNLYLTEEQAYELARQLSHTVP